MKSFKDRRILEKLVLPLVSVGSVACVVIVVVSYFMFVELRQHAIPELTGTYRLQGSILDLVGEYREYTQSPSPEVLDEINALKTEIDNQTQRLDYVIFELEHLFGSETIDQSTLDKALLNALRKHQIDLLATGDRLIADRQNFRTSLAPLEVSEAAIEDIVRQAEASLRGKKVLGDEEGVGSDDRATSRPEESILPRLSTAAHAFRSEAHEYALEPNDESRAGLEGLANQLQQRLADYALATRSEDEEVVFVATLETAVEDLIARVASLVQARDRVSSGLEALEEISESYQSYLKELTRLSTAAAFASVKNALLAIAGAALSALVSITIATFLVSRRVARSISRLRETASQFSQGDFTKPARIESEDEVGVLAREFNTMGERLSSTIADLSSARTELVRSERLAAVGQLTATVSHELRNPLGAIRNATDVIKKLADDENPRMVRALSLLDRSQRRCDIVIEDLLNFTRVRALSKVERSFDDWLGSFLDEVVLPPNIVLRRDLDADATVAFDRDRLERSLQNLIDNARHALEGSQEDCAPDAECHVTITTRLRDDRVELSVEDNGPGIPPDEMQQIFEPLFTTKSFGVGLGLPMVKQIMEQHGGGIDVTSDPGKGAKFVLWLPIALPD